ncbi:MAG: diacylglycerol kinase family protein [Flavisolibacter sp.]
MSNNPNRFSVKARVKSFVFAWAGIIRFFRTEHNAQIHLAATIIVSGLCLYFKTTKSETLAIVFVIALVWITEMINTSIEKAMDFVSPQRDLRIKTIKDLSAGAVLVAAIVSVIVGGIIFIPKIF